MIEEFSKGNPARQTYCQTDDFSLLLLLHPSFIYNLFVRYELQAIRQLKQFEYLGLICSADSDLCVIFGPLLS